MKYLKVTGAVAAYLGFIVGVTWIFKMPVEVAFWVGVGIGYPTGLLIGDILMN